MIVELGHFAALLALSFSLVALVAAVLAIRAHPSASGGWRQVALRAYLATAGLLTLSLASLLYALLTRDFSLQYVAEHSNSRLPFFYTVAALWGGHEGSLLLWAWMLSLVSGLALAYNRQWEGAPHMAGVLSLILFGFLSQILFLSNPFARLEVHVPDGRDLNPLLQDPEMVLHPPMLFLGYTGFAVPFAFAMASLLQGGSQDEWIRRARRWILFAWLALTVGIALGGHWAYRILGWGGYWAWDPVENASFMPWLVGTALLHSAVVQEKRRMFVLWNLSLAIVAFALSILGTFLVRSGIISSVHAFASDPSRGIHLLSFFAAILVLSFGLLIVRSNRVPGSAGVEGILSREGVFLTNNLFFLVAALVVFLGTLYPMVMELLQGRRVTVAAPYFNQVFIPLMLAALFFMGLGPLVPWRRAEGKALVRTFRVPAAAAVVAGGILFGLGIRQPLSLLALIVGMFVLATVAQEFFASARIRASQLGASLLRGAMRMVAANTRRWGAMLAHVGVIVLVIGFVGSGGYQLEKEVYLPLGQQISLGPYVIRLDQFRSVQGPNWEGLEGVLTVLREGREVEVLLPQKRIYPARPDMPMTEVATLHTLWHDLYLVLGEVSPDQGATVKAYLNPLILAVWGGLLLIVAGGVLVFLHHRQQGRGKGS